MTDYPDLIYLSLVLSAPSYQKYTMNTSSLEEPDYPFSRSVTTVAGVT